VATFLKGLKIASWLTVGAMAGAGAQYAVNVGRLTRLSLEPGAAIMYRAEDADLFRFVSGLGVIRGDAFWWYPTRFIPRPARILHRYEMALEHREGPTDPVEDPTREGPVFLRLWTTRGRIALAMDPGAAKDFETWLSAEAVERP
jgi:hypothetical protein